MFGCLSGRQYHTICSLAFGLLAAFKNQSRITPMRRICSSLIFYVWISMRLYGALIFTDFFMPLTFCCFLYDMSLYNFFAQLAIRAVQAQVHSHTIPPLCQRLPPLFFSSFSNLNKNKKSKIKRKQYLYFH